MSDTIAAIATAQIPSAIGILRLSGPETLTIIDRVFLSKNHHSICDQDNRKMVYGDLLDTAGNIIDNVLCVKYLAPNSYTGEDCAEIFCHGSPVVLNEGLLSLFHAGARQAEGGEFTKRAFLNGRMDLIQAESVVDLIDAETAEAARNAVGQLNGVLSASIDRIYDGLMDIVSRFYAVVDYPDEDIEDLQREQMLDTLRESENKLEELLATFSRGRMLKMGIPTVILGRPNVGKSSLLNALLGYNRAIVTDIPGTTRDTVEEKVQIQHVLLRLCDTAGIRESADTVEAIGVERAKDAAKNASLALLVLDGSQELTDEDEEVIAVAKEVPHLLVVVNKTDLGTKLNVGHLADRFDNVVSISAKEHTGIQILCDAIGEMFPSSQAVHGELLTNARQADAVSRALTSIRSARTSLRIGMTPDVVLTDTESAMESLGELNGKKIREELVATIFDRFCVGK